jgi:hypothetical protein
MATLKDVKARAKVLGAKVEEEKDSLYHECRVQSPHRKHWIDGTVHEIVECVHRPWAPDYADILSRMNSGLDDCVGECEWCDGE